jgi:hypothetical protein
MPCPYDLVAGRIGVQIDDTGAGRSARVEHEGYLGVWVRVKHRRMPMLHAYQHRRGRRGRGNMPMNV